MLYFLFYKLVYYLVDETTFPSERKELCGRWVGVSKNVGHFMTYKILTDDTHWIIHHSIIHSAADPNARNLRLDPLNDEPPEVIWSLHKASPASDHGEDFSLHSMEPTDEHPYTESTPDPSERPSTGDDMVIVNPQELLGCTFLMGTQEDGQSFRARIVDEHPYTESTPDPSERPSTGDDMVIVDPQELLGCTFLMGTQEDGQSFRARIVDEHPYTESTPDPSERPSTGDNTVIVDPQELLGCTFLMGFQEDDQRFRARIDECISNHESNVRRSDDHAKFRISINEDEYKEIITYNKLMDFIEKNQENDAIVWRF
jgi:hypothetical protein